MEQNKNFTEETIKKLHTFDLSDFKKAQDDMVVISNSNSDNQRSYWNNRRIDYTAEEIEKIIESGNISEQQQLSRYYFNKDGYYKQLILYYSTLLKYIGILIPNPTSGKNLSTPHIQKRYFSALDYVERMNLSTFCVDCAQKALVNGCYYGLVVRSNKNNFSVLDLPISFCRSRFKDLEGNDIVEFNVTYFRTIQDDLTKRAIEQTYPAYVLKAARKYENGKLSSPWVPLFSEDGICFSMFDSRPFFLSIIPSTIQYDDTLQTDLEREKEEIRKIIVQKIPHLNDGRLLFEPEEAVQIHNGAVGMVRNNKNTTVLTTYTDVDAITSKATGEKGNTLLEDMKQNIYSKAGVSSEIFAATGGNTSEVSIRYDTAIMMYFANKVAKMITSLLNQNFGNSNITFKYKFLDITAQNVEKYMDSSYKLATAGYSLLVPALAQGFSQRDLSNIKDLENDILQLPDKLIPPKTAFTQTDDTGGRPAKEEGEKKDQTIRNEKSIEKSKVQGGSE